MATPKPETIIVQKIRDYLETFSACKVIKIHGNMFQRNQPDLIGCFDGQMFCLEVKQEGFDARPAQASELRKWDIAGAITAVVHNVEEVEELFIKNQLIAPSQRRRARYSKMDLA
jgi:hypothetical protein